MQSMSLRYFQREGGKSLEAEGVAEPVLLTGRDQEYLLLPVAAESRSQLLDLVEGWTAVLALQAGQRRAVRAKLDRLTEDEIRAEVRAARETVKKKSKRTSSAR